MARETRGPPHEDLDLSAETDSHRPGGSPFPQAAASGLHPPIHREAYAAVLQWIAGVRAGSEPPLVVVGPSGVGKTVLWETVRAAAERSIESWLYAKVGQVDQRPYGVVSQLLTSRPARTAELLVEDGFSAAARSFVVTIAPSVAPYLSYPRTADYAALRDPPDELAKLLARLALGRHREPGAGRESRSAMEHDGDRGHCGILCIDDYQWIDRYSREVLLRLLRSEAAPGVAILTRGGSRGDTLPDFALLPRAPTVVPLRTLTREETRALVTSVVASDEIPPEETIDRLYELSEGNPMAVTSLLSSGMREEALVGDVLVAIAAERLARLPEGVRSVLRVMGLLGSPVSLDRLRGAGGFPERVVDQALEDAERTRLAYRDRSSDLVRFAHDSVETAVRREGENDPIACRVARDLLLADARAGNGAAAYAAARLLEERRGDDISVDDWALVYGAASRQALASLAPMEAINLAEIGLARARGEDRVRLNAICHEAAYLAADRERMSRYYRRIVLEGSATDVAEARYLWVRRCYADTRFPGALATGVRILTRLPTIGDTFEWSSDTSRSREFLRHHTPRALLRAIRRRGRSRDPAVTRAMETLSRMLLPSMTVAREKTVHLARFALEISLQHGWTASTGFGFAAWAVHCAGEREAGPWVRPYFESAEAIAGDSGDPVAVHSIRMFSTGFGMHWYRPYHAFIARLAQLAESGRGEGNWEYVAHCVHLRLQALLFRGASLASLLGEFGKARGEIREYGLMRTDLALSKHHQAVEVLLGMAPDPVRLDGRIITEDEYYRSIVTSGDRISMAGYRTVKALLAFFADRPDLVVEELTLIDEFVSAISLFHDLTVVPFYLGVSAYRVGRTTTGDRARATLRRLARAIPETYRHRYLFVLAERDVLRGHRLRARYRFDQARRLAEAGGYLSEAAMIWERRGDTEKDHRAWRAAEVLYLEWGALHALARVREKRGLHADAPVPWQSRLVLSSLEREFAQAVSVDAVVAALSRVIAPSAPPAEITVVFHDHPSGIQESLMLRTDGGVARGNDQIPPDVRLLLGELGPGESRLVAPGELRRPAAPGLAVRTPRIGGAECAVLAIGRPDRAAYTEETLPVAAAAVSAAAPALVLAVLRSRLDADETALDDVRRQLSQTEEYRRELFSTISDAFLLVDTAGVVVFSNPAAGRYLTRVEDGSDYGGHRLVPVLNEEIVRLALAGDERSVLRQVPVATRERSVHIRVAPVESATEAPLFAVSIYDVTEEVEREGRLAQQERRLIVADRLAAIGTFSAAIAHEISNPNHILQLNTQSLSVVMSWIAAEVGGDPAAAPMVTQARELLGQVEDAAQRIEAVLQLIKSYGREGRIEAWNDVDLNEVAARAFRFSRIMAAQYSDHVRFIPHPAPVVVRGEPALLEQAIVNLIRNACEALQDRDGRVELRVSGRPAGGAVSISDSGRGFPEELRERLATPFATGRAESGGTGLGLSIVAGIVEKHRGELTVERVAGEYSTRVSILIPAGPTGR